MKKIKYCGIKLYDTRVPYDLISLNKKEIKLCYINIVMSDIIEFHKLYLCVSTMLELIFEISIPPSPENDLKECVPHIFRSLRS